MICYGSHAFDIVGRHLIFVVGLGIIPSWIISYLVYWKKNRYLNYFAILCRIKFLSLLKYEELVKLAIFAK